MLKPLPLTLMTLLLLSGCTHGTSSHPAHPAPGALQPLLDTMTQRLEIANDVALSKWYSGKPVQDSERERQVILNAQAQAAAFKLTPDQVEAFMSAQMEANKQVQYARIEQWRTSGQVPATPDVTLTTGIRARLDALQPVLMQNYAAFVPYRTDSHCLTWVREEIARRAAEPVIARALQRATEGLCASGATT